LTRARIRRWTVTNCGRRLPSSWEKPNLLAGGTPRIAKADGDAAVQVYIAVAAVDTPATKVIAESQVGQGRGTGIAVVPRGVFLVPGP
jgi:hypothetical protein